MRLSLAFLGVVVFASAFPLLLSADDARPKDRLSALAIELKKPDGMRAAFKLVDAGPAAVPELLSRLGASPLADERIEACLREIARTKEGARVEIERFSQASSPLSRARIARALASANAPEAIYPITDSLDAPQETLEVSTFGPQGEK